MPIPALIDGWSRFRKGRFQDQRGLFDELHRHGQSPTVAMVACCDSRVDPAMVFDCDPGDLFVVRNVANLVPPYEESGSYHGTSAALEFAVSVLGVQHVVVLGHALCGGIRALLDGPPQTDPPLRFLPSWIGLATEALEETVGDGPSGGDVEARALRLEQAAIRLSERNLLTFPAIRERVRRGRLVLHGWHFDFRDGELMVHDLDRDRFVPAGDL